MRLAAVPLAVLALACSQPVSEPPADPPDEPIPPDDDDDEEPTVIERLEAWNASLSAADRRAKYCKMAASPFTFYRGTNHLFWEDTWGDARLADRGAPRDIWLQGDLHVANFGAYDEPRRSQRESGPRGAAELRIRDPSELATGGGESPHQRPGT